MGELDFQGQKIKVDEVSFSSVEEGDNIYALADGYRLKVKTVLVGVYRKVGVKGEDGNPVYLLKTKNIASVFRESDQREEGAGK